jgi:plastocyanin
MLAATAVALLALTSVGCNGGDAGGITPPPGTPESMTVVMPGNSFSPYNVAIKVTGTVNFDFPSDEHDVTFEPRTGVPANIPVTSRKVVPRKFNTVGIFPYDCKVHPGMSGQVTVTE